MSEIRERVEGLAGIPTDLLAELERVEERLSEQKRAAWNHEGVSKDYLLMKERLCKRDERIAELETKLEQAEKKIRWNRAHRLGERGCGLLQRHC